MKLALAIAPLAAASPGAAFAATPMSYLTTFGPKGDRMSALVWGLLIQSIVVVLLISLFVLLGVWLRRSRQRFGPIGDQPIERESGGLHWITIGVGLSTIALIGSTVWTVATMARINSPDREPALTIEVRGHQWWWEVRYRSNDSSRIFTTANEIHIPVGQPVRFKLETADVIHSFWVPALGGKTDLIPNQTNTTWLEASAPGVYRGQCVEYCGMQHAHMILVVFADEPEAFRTWWDRQLAPPGEPSSKLAAQGEASFMSHCAACHAVRGTPAGGVLGPDLSHLMLRHTVGAGTLPNTTAYLSGWIANPQEIKPGAKMPNLDISGPELASIRAFLETLN